MLLPWGTLTPQSWLLKELTFAYHGAAFFLSSSCPLPRFPVLRGTHGCTMWPWIRLPFGRGGSKRPALGSAVWSCRWFSHEHLAAGPWSLRHVPGCLVAVTWGEGISHMQKAYWAESFVLSSLNCFHPYFPMILSVVGCIGGLIASLSLTHWNSPSLCHWDVFSSLKFDLSFYKDTRQLPVFESVLSRALLFQAKFPISAPPSTCVTGHPLTFN